MKINEYQTEALRTASEMNQDVPMIVNGVLGLCGEAGECADMVKKHLFQGHELDEWRQFCDWIFTLPHSSVLREGVTNEQS